MPLPPMPPALPPGFGAPPGAPGMQQQQPPLQMPPGMPGETAAAATDTADVVRCSRLRWGHQGLVLGCLSKC
jgi:hypothetical protein